MTAVEQMLDGMHDLKNIKREIQAEIEAHGVDVPSDTPFNVYPEKIREISLGVGSDGIPSFIIEDVGATSFLLVLTGDILPDLEDMFFSLTVNGQAINNVTFLDEIHVLIEHAVMPVTELSNRLVMYEDFEEGHFYGVEYLILNSTSAVFKVRDLLISDPSTLTARVIGTTPGTTDSAELKAFLVDVILDASEILDTESAVTLAETIGTEATIEVELAMSIYVEVPT